MCGSDIDAAIKHLGELQLSADNASDIKSPLTLPAHTALRKAANGAPAVLQTTGVVQRTVIHCVQKQRIFILQPHIDVDLVEPLKHGNASKGK